MEKNKKDKFNLHPSQVKSQSMCNHILVTNETSTNSGLNSFISATINTQYHEVYNHTLG